MLGVKLLLNHREHALHEVRLIVHQVTIGKHLGIHPVLQVRKDLMQYDIPSNRRRRFTQAFMGTHEFHIAIVFSRQHLVSKILLLGQFTDALQGFDIRCHFVSGQFLDILLSQQTLQFFQ